MTRANTAYTLIALLSACVRLDPVEPSPLPPDDDTAVVVVPDPLDPPPDPQEPDPLDPTGPVVDARPCAAADARYKVLGCAPAIENYVEACEAQESLGLAYSFMPACQSHATSCAAWNRCATGAR